MKKTKVETAPINIIEHAEPPKFVQITSNNGDIVCLDERGRVWKYCPATQDRYAFWTPLTEHRATPK